MISLIKSFFKNLFFYNHRTSQLEIEIIKNTTLFNKIGTERFNKLFKKVNLLRFEEGKLIIKEGEPADALYIIIDGSVHIFIFDQHGTKISLATLNKGGYFGEQALIARTNKTRNANIEALSKTSLIKINDSIMFEILSLDTALENKLKKTGLDQAFKILRVLEEMNKLERVAPTGSVAKRAESSDFPRLTRSSHIKF